MSVTERISNALTRSGKSQRDLAKHMGLTSPTVSAQLSKEEIDSIKYLQATAEITGYSFEWLRTGTGPEKKSDALMVNEPALNIKDYFEWEGDQANHCNC